MRAIFLGPPGAGKGTQAQRLAEEYKLMHISTGDLLRGALKKNSPVGKKARKYMEGGALVPDEVVTEIVQERIQSTEAERGFILDGFPRNQTQAVGLDAIMKRLGLSIDLVVNFNTPIQVVRERLSGRRVCSDCNTNFHLKNFPPRPDGRCTRCGGELVIRPDDRDQTVEERLRVYEEWGQPLCKFYQGRVPFKEVSGEQPSLKQYEVLKQLFIQADDHDHSEVSA